MDIFFVILPALLIVILYAVIFTRKGEPQRMKTGFRQFDWITNLSVLFGVIALLNGLSNMGIDISSKWAIALVVALFILLFGVILYRIIKKKPITRCADDERTNQIYAKSARNALFITFLGLFIIIGRDADLVTTKWITIILGAGLVTLFTSMFFYYYRES